MRVMIDGQWYTVSGITRERLIDEPISQVTLVLVENLNEDKEEYTVEELDTSDLEVGEALAFFEWLVGKKGSPNGLHNLYISGSYEGEV